MERLRSSWKFSANVDGKIDSPSLGPATAKAALGISFLDYDYADQVHRAIKDS